jgi:hypothetical protein
MLKIYWYHRLLRISLTVMEPDVLFSHPHNLQVYLKDQFLYQPIIYSEVLHVVSSVFLTKI